VLSRCVRGCGGLKEKYWGKWRKSYLRCAAKLLPLRGVRKVNLQLTKGKRSARPRGARAQSPGVEGAKNTCTYLKKVLNGETTAISAATLYWRGGLGVLIETSEAVDGEGVAHVREFIHHGSTIPGGNLIAISLTVWEGRYQKQKAKK